MPPKIKARDRFVSLRTTGKVVETIDQAAEAVNSTRANWVRLAIKEKLQRDGWLDQD